MISSIFFIIYIGYVTNEFQDINRIDLVVFTKIFPHKAKLLRNIIIRSRLLMCHVEKHAGKRARQGDGAKQRAVCVRN